VNNKPLVVDLDGTLLNSDMLVESGVAFVRKNPLQFYRPLWWLLTGGKAHLKARIADRVEIDIALLPFNEPVLEWLRAEKASGRSLVLATASHQSYAEQIGQHLGLFDRVLGSSDTVNLTARNKCAALVDEFGEGGFDYAGNSRDDLPVWRSAADAIVVNPEAGVARQAQAEARVTKLIDERASSGRAWIKALRVHQWLKNLLIFVPLFAAHRFTSLPLLLDAILAFLLFSVCASSLYLLNDMLDLEQDRQHTSKRMRPFAAGTIPVAHGLVAVPVLLGLAFTLSFLLLPLEFTGVLALYAAGSLSYSLAIKRIVVADVVMLASLYTARIVAGTLACELTFTFWLLAFPMFMFFSLALVKRYAELHRARGEGKTGRTAGRGYYPDDLPMIASLGAASGYLSVMVLALYIQEQSTVHLYRNPQFIWLACPIVLFWISRTWVLTHRGFMKDDPVVFAVTDKVSLLTGVLLFLAFWMAA
jgi:4-hydroxybenzoate polyprenyltransferase